MANKPNASKRKNYPKDRSNVKNEDRRTRKSNCDFDTKVSQDNDWHWYAVDEQLLKDSASFPYAWPVGNKMDLGQYGYDVNESSIPGIMTIHMVPSFGWADEANAPINVAARNQFSFIRHANSGSWSYNAPDLMLYLMAMDSVYSYISFLKRLYGIALTYSYTNRYYPDALLRCQGVNATDIHRNLADFRAGINMLVVKAGSLCVPANMSYHAKHTWLYDGYYLDSMQDKAQTYIFTPLAFYRYTYDQDLAGKLEYTPFGPEAMFRSSYYEARDNDKPLTVKQLLDYGDLLLNPILADQDMNVMSGDIFKAYGPGGIYKLSSLPEAYTVLPVYSEEVLDQIQNLSLVGVPQSDRMDLKQEENKGFLVYTPYIQVGEYVEASAPAGLNALFSDRIISFSHGGVTPANTMEATRMTNILSDLEKTGAASAIAACKTAASEIACFARIWFYTTDVSSGWTLASINKLRITNPGELIIPMDLWNEEAGSVLRAALVDVVGDSVRLTNQISTFDWHPAMANTFVVTTKDSLNGNVTHRDYAGFSGYQMDINYYTVVNASDLMVMANVALQSMFNIIQYGRA